MRINHSPKQVNSFGTRSSHASSVRLDAGKNLWFHMSRRTRRRQQQQQQRLFQASKSNDTTNNSPSDNKRGSRLEKRIDQVLHRMQNLPPLIQLISLISMYIVHLLVLTQHVILFPFQIIPNEKGWFQSIGLDSVAGIISFISIALLRKRQLGKKDGKVTIPSLFSGVYDYQVVEEQRSTTRGSNGKTKGKKSKSKQSKRGGTTNNGANNTNTEQITKKTIKHRSSSLLSSPWRFPLTTQDNTPSARITSMAALTLLVSAYFFTGRLSSMIELYLYALAGLGVPLTIAMHRSLVVLGGHLAWVAIGSAILGIVLRPQPFFGGGNKMFEVEEMTQNDAEKKSDNYDDEDEREESKDIYMTKQKYKWFTNKWNSNWLWWTIGGYFISSWFFNIADFLNQNILPAHVFELAGEGVVSQLINPENNDIAASLVGYIAPCITAPWWEEVLYRGFLLPALTLNMKFWPSVFVSGIVFSVHHVSTTGAIPLAILGWTWAAIYAKSGNLMVTILIHAMWNSRVFLGSWLGL